MPQLTYDQIQKLQRGIKEHPESYQKSFDNEGICPGGSCTECYMCYVADGGLHCAQFLVSTVNRSFNNEEFVTTEDLNSICLDLLIYISKLKKQLEFDL